MTTSLRILIVCFSGALIGGLVGLQFNLPLTGLCVGCLAGYLGYDIRGARDLAVKVFRTIMIDYRAKLNAKLNEQYPSIAKAASKYASNFRSFMKSYANCTGAAIILITLSIGVIVLVVDGYAALTQWFNIERIGTIVLASAWFGFMVTSCYCVDDGLVVKKIPNPFVCIKHLAGCTVFLLAQLGHLLMFILRGMRTYFIAIHSDLRLLCACNIALGTSVGYFAGNALVGGIAGGIFGVLSYQVISIRLLKVSPVRRA